ncbi:uncharacterized protein LOC118513238 [Anopheles stephensi]|uniref:uncharacterized protein LOC118513238 n=1 Tax=Anopheles stephensi TaxID=30069 RepID=UPI001658A28A|nr:uncharacterized protein LOC118513238 [Anopheles stephensi]
MNRNASHFNRLRATGQLYNMPARREASERAAKQQPGNAVPPDSTNGSFLVEENETIDGVPIMEVPDDYIDNTNEASDFDEENNWLSLDDGDDDDNDGEVITFSGGVSQLRGMQLQEALQYWALTTYKPRSSECKSTRQH